MSPVRSCHIEAIGYDPELSERYVRFGTPTEVTYVYWMVEKRMFDEFLRAASKGQYFNDRIKRRYPYREV
jgi:hypothetical protein